MNILFPMNGLGKRFSNDGYLEPKPIIRVGGVPLAVKVLKSFSFDDTDKIFISYHRELKKYNFEHMIISMCPELEYQLHFYCFQHDTLGAADTLIQSIDIFDLHGENLLVADCDVIHNPLTLNWFRGCITSAIGYSIETNPDPIYSYIKIGVNDEVEDIAEKKKISDNACCGLYYFNKDDLCRLPDIYNGFSGEIETYISHLYRELIKNSDVIAREVNNFYCVGTPIQLQSYCGEASGMAKDMRICFDLDNTLVTYPEIAGDYTTVKPINRNINILKELKKHGAYIIIYTARRMKTHGGNVSKLIADIGEITLNTLKEFGIPYDEICFGKPYAHFYVDDLSINAYTDAEKALGVYFNRIESRSKHKITYKDGLCIKEGDVTGEFFWYSSVPLSIHPYLPKIHHMDANKIVMDEIKDIPISHLYVRNSFSLEQMGALFNIMDVMHSIAPSKYDSLNITGNENYADKVFQRCQTNEFRMLAYKAHEIAKECIRYFDQYSVPKHRIRLIHGDPVFSNIFCSFDNKFIFVDPRGKVGDHLTIYGDIFYDYAKLYQSCIGYDFILLGRPVDTHVVSNFKHMFRIEFFKRFSREDFEEVKMITKSLVVSLLPLHSPDKADKFLELIKSIK